MSAPYLVLVEFFSFSSLSLNETFLFFRGSSVVFYLVKDGVYGFFLIAFFFLVPRKRRILLESSHSPEAGLRCQVCCVEFFPSRTVLWTALTTHGFVSFPQLCFYVDCGRPFLTSVFSVAVVPRYCSGSPVLYKLSMFRAPPQHSEFPAHDFF